MCVSHLLAGLPLLTPALISLLLTTSPSAMLPSVYFLLHDVKTRKAVLLGT